MRCLSLILLLITFHCVLPARAQEGQDSLSVGFVTCYPGPEIFELYGHEGVRVSGRLNGHPIDVVFNYGLFDFNSPGFIYRFVKGETDYKIGFEPTELFLYPYKERGSRVVERVLPLTQDEAHRMFELLCEDVKPENNTYRYKYFSANCATRPLDHLEEVTGGRLTPKPDKDALQITYRDLLKRYNEGYPWYQFGIDLVLGLELDKPVTPRQASFVPVELENLYFRDMPVRVINEGQGDMRLAPTPIMLRPWFVAWLLFAAAMAFVLLKWRSRVVYACWFGLQGMVGLLVCWLVFFSYHEGTSPNLLAWWLNPVWLLIPILIWRKSWHRICNCVLTANAVVTGTLLLTWPILPQATNPAVFPLMGITILLAVVRRY